jgi:hypothetical protein
MVDVAAHAERHVHVRSLRPVRDLAQGLRDLVHPAVVVVTAPFDDGLEGGVVVAAPARIRKTQRRTAHVRRGQRADLRPGAPGVTEHGDHQDAHPPRGVGEDARSAGEKNVIVVRGHVEAVARQEGLEIDGDGHERSGAVDHPRSLGVQSTASRGRPRPSCRRLTTRANGG